MGDDRRIHAVAVSHNLMATASVRVVDIVGPVVGVECDGDRCRICHPGLAAAEQAGKDGSDG